MKNMDEYTNFYIRPFKQERTKDMILYNIVLGNQKLTPNSWSHIIDDFGNHFIAKDDINQRIRIDNKVDDRTYPDLGELKPVWSAANMQCYNILTGTRYVTNNRNMNPLLLTSKEYADGEDQIVIYITVSNNYAIARFNTSHRILQTYHKKDMFQGCAIVLDTKDRAADNRIITISVYDKKNDQYSKFNISFNKDDLNAITVKRKAITDKEFLDKIKAQTRKFKSRYMGFKILTKPEDLLTSVYVVSDKFKQDVINTTKNINKVNIITINPDQIAYAVENELTDELDKITNKLQKEFETNRIKAITQCGVSLPLDMIRKLKLLYVFDYDVTNKVLSCRKSN
jgi:hypothetical protein